MLLICQNFRWFSSTWEISFKFISLLIQGLPQSNLLYTRGAFSSAFFIVPAGLTYPCHGAHSPSPPHTFFPLLHSWERFQAVLQGQASPRLVQDLSFLCFSRSASLLGASPLVKLAFAEHPFVGSPLCFSLRSKVIPLLLLLPCQSFNHSWFLVFVFPLISVLFF